MTGGNTQIVIDRAAINQRAGSTRRSNTGQRNSRLVQEFNNLFGEQRIRYDDVLNYLSDRYTLSTSTITRILKTQ